MMRLALLAIAGVLVAGCGSSGRMSKPTYGQELRSEGSFVQKAVTNLTKAAPSSSSDVVTVIDDAEAVVKKAADDLSAIKPPADAVADNAAIVAAFRRIQSGLEQVKATPAAAQRIVTAMGKSPQLKAAEKAIADLKQKGYKVGAFGAP
jgi:hypothetical protein